MVEVPGVRWVWMEEWAVGGCLGDFSNLDGSDVLRCLKTKEGKKVTGRSAGLGGVSPGRPTDHR